MEHQLGLTALFNQFLGGLANTVLDLVGQPAAHREQPWENWLVMEILVVVLLMVAAAIARAVMSTDKPGALQHIFEATYGFVAETARDAGVHHAEKYVPYFATLFIFLVAMNMLGAIPAFESPTMFAWVPAGLAVWTFLYYNTIGFKTHGIGYVKQFVGPVWYLFFLMIPIEIISHFIRPLSLTVRLYGNMYAGEAVTMAFTNLVPFVVPVIFAALHVFVGLVQAYVFTMLAMIYVAGATSHEH